VPRRRDVAGLSAACAAVLIALQLGVTHWFYLYVPWFFGLVMVAVLGRGSEPEERPLAAGADDDRLQTANGSGPGPQAPADLLGPAPRAG